MILKIRFTSFFVTNHGTSVVFCQIYVSLKTIVEYHRGNTMQYPVVLENIHGVVNLVISEILTGYVIIFFNCHHKVKTIALIF